jgi:hypothetical protein
MRRSHDAEVPPVDGRDIADAEAFGSDDDRGVYGPERQVVVLRDKLDHAEWVCWVEGLKDEGTTAEVAEEAGLGLPAQSRSEQVCNLRNHEGGNDERPRVGFQQLEAGGMVRVVGVDVRVERAGVDDQRDRADSARMISSTRSEMSLRPLRPAAAAPNLRRDPVVPRCASSAVRVISAIVVPRRCASWRRRASRSSESLTVVRCIRMPAYHHGRRLGRRRILQGAKYTPRGSGRRDSDGHGQELIIKNP